MCIPFGQVLVGRQRIPVSYPSLEDIVLLSPREHISDYSCDVRDYTTTFQITYPHRMSLIDCQTLSLKIARDYQVLPILQYIFRKIKKHQRNSDIGKQWLTFYHHIIRIFSRSRTTSNTLALSNYCRRRFHCWHHEHCRYTQ